MCYMQYLWVYRKSFADCVFAQQLLRGGDKRRRRRRRRDVEWRLQLQDRR